MCVSMRNYVLKVCEHAISQTAWEFHQIYSVGAFIDKAERDRFWGQKVKGQGHTETKCGHISIFGIVKVIRSNVSVQTTFPVKA